MNRTLLARVLMWPIVYSLYATMVSSDALPFVCCWVDQRKHSHGMCLGIENMFVQNVNLRVWILQQIHIFQGFGHEKGFLLVPGMLVLVLHRTECSVTIGSATIFFYGLKHFPTPFSVGWISCQLIEDEERFHGLWPQQVMGSSCSDSEVFSGTELNKFC